MSRLVAVVHVADFSVEAEIDLERWAEERNARYREIHESYDHLRDTPFVPEEWTPEIFVEKTVRFGFPPGIYSQPNDNWLPVKNSGSVVRDTVSARYVVSFKVEPAFPVETL